MMLRKVVPSMSQSSKHSFFIRRFGRFAGDILEKQPIPQNQVYYFWKDIKQETNSEEFVDDYDQTGFGIGIIRVT